MPKPQNIEHFFGDEKKNKLDFDMWERQVCQQPQPIQGQPSTGNDASLKGPALMVTSALPPDASWKNCYKL